MCVCMYANVYIYIYMYLETKWLRTCVFSPKALAWGFSFNKRFSNCSRPNACVYLLHCSVDRVALGWIWPCPSLRAKACPYRDPTNFGMLFKYMIFNPTSFPFCSSSNSADCLFEQKKTINPTIGPEDVVMIHIDTWWCMVLHSALLSSRSLLPNHLPNHPKFWNPSHFGFPSHFADPSQAAVNAHERQGASGRPWSLPLYVRRNVKPLVAMVLFIIKGVPCRTFYKWIRRV
jgi:hypothetical protein